ncbi:MAG: hypothetical protein R2849_02355 [Thermomicrobiales bacterium]
MPALMQAGFEAGEGPGQLSGKYDDEFVAFLKALDQAHNGDVIAVMSQVDQDRMIEEIKRRGGVERVPSG